MSPAHFQRIEKKFRLSEDCFRQLQPILLQHMQPDRYAESTVYTIYYDTEDYALIRRSVERPRFKEKLRLRSYGIPAEDSPVFVEIKRKLNGIGYKRRICVPFCQARQLLQGFPIGSAQPQIEGELLALIRRYAPEPRVLLSCRRQALAGIEDTGLRVTIDRDLCYRTQHPEQPDAAGLLPVLEDGSLILEIKSARGIPAWLTQALSQLEIRQQPFSKIGTCYTKHIAPLQKQPSVQRASVLMADG